MSLAYAPVQAGLPRADEARPPLRLVRAPRRRRLPRALGPTTISLLLHGIAVVVLLAVTLAPPPKDGIGAKLSVALTASLPETFEEEVLEQEQPDIEELEPIEMPELPVVYAEATPLPPEEETLEPLEDCETCPSRIEIPVTVVSQRTRPEPKPPVVAPPVERRMPVVAARIVPKPRPKPRRRMAASGGNLRALHQPLYYPEGARRRGVQGVARVEMVIGADGVILTVRLSTSSGHPMLDQAALSSARQWRFAPIGAPRRVVQPFRFWLR